MAARRHSPRIALVALITLLSMAVIAASAVAASAPRLRGVQLHSLWWDSSNADMDRELDLAQQANANVVRVDVNWGSLETGGKGQHSQWYVDKLDRFVDGANARGMKVIAMLFSTPCWASSAPDSVKQGCEGAWWDRGVSAYPPTNPADYGDVARYLTSRYGTKLAALEVWNEPNLDGQWFWKTPDEAGDYARLLKAAYPAAKGGNSEVPVLAGSLAHADKPFLDELFANGIKGFHDGLAVHPYNEWRAPGDLWQDQWKKYTMLPGLEWLRQSQQAAGAETPIWVTEFGWTTGTDSGWRVSEADQATYIKDSFPLLANLGYVDAAVVYNLRNKGTDPASHEDNFGVLRRDFSKKPAYDALRDALAGATSPPSPPPPEDPPRFPAGEEPDPEPDPLATRIEGFGVRSSKGKMYAYGQTAPGGRVNLKVSECGSVNRYQTEFTVGDTGRFDKRVGSAARMGGCRVTATLRLDGPDFVTSVTVPVRTSSRGR